MAKNFSLLGLISLVFAMFIWASSFIALKSAMASLGEYTIIFLRMSIASLCFVYFIKDFKKYEFSKKDVKYIFLLSLFEPCLYFIFEAKALSFTSASQAGMITSLMPLITAFTAGYFLKEIISRRLIFGSLLSIVGVVSLSVQATSTINAPNPILGNFLEFCAMICASGYAITARYLAKKYSALFITASQSFIGAIFFLPLFIYEYNTVDMVFSFKAMAWVFYLGVVVTLGGYGLYNFALTKMEASKASMFINLIPVFTLVLSFFILKEKLSIAELIASITILVGVILSQIKIKTKSK